MLEKNEPCVRLCSCSHLGALACIYCRMRYIRNKCVRFHTAFKQVFAWTVTIVSYMYCVLYKEYLHGLNILLEPCGKIQKSSVFIYCQVLPLLNKVFVVVVVVELETVVVYNYFKWMEDSIWVLDNEIAIPRN